MNGLPKAVARPIIAILFVAGSFFIYYVITAGMCDPAWNDIVNIIVGAVIANVTAIVQYYFGSSSGSSQKTDIMAHALEKRP